MGSSRISEENFNCRLQREKAKTGALSVSLAWNDPSDLDLEATVILEKGGQAKIYYQNKQAAGGYLDVDMHARDGDEVDEPVENIFWKKPPAGTYSISVNLYKKRGAQGAAIPFRAVLKCDGDDDMSCEGQVENEPGERRVEVFRFTVDDDAEVTMGEVGTPLPAPKPGPAGMGSPRIPQRAMRRPRPVSMKVMKVMKVKKAMKVKRAMKVSAIAKGKKAKVAVWQGKKLKTLGGLKREDLVKSSKRKIVSASRSQQGKKSKWSKATAKARAIKGYTGFKPIKKGTSFYKKAREIMAEM
jgi:hypothetical protein